MCLSCLPKSLAVQPTWEGVGWRNEWSLNIMTVCVQAVRQKVVSTTPLLISKPFMILRETIHIVYTLKFLTFNPSPIQSPPPTHDGGLLPPTVLNNKCYYWVYNYTYRGFLIRINIRKSITVNKSYIKVIIRSWVIGQTFCFTQVYN